MKRLIQLSKYLVLVFLVITSCQKDDPIQYQPILYNQILGKWDVNNMDLIVSKNSDGKVASKASDKECIVYSIVFNSDGSFVLSLSSGEIQGTFYFDSSNSIVLNDQGKFDNLHINNNTLNFHLNLNNLCSLDGEADNDDDYVEGECVSFLNCNDGNVWVKQIDTGLKYVRVTNDLQNVWVEHYIFDTEWKCIRKEVTNLTSEYPIILLENDLTQMTYVLDDTPDGDVTVVLKVTADNHLSISYNYNDDLLDNADYYDLSSQESLYEYLNSYENCPELTYVPDDNFEQALIDLGYDNVLDDYVKTSNIKDITILNLDKRGISDATGIEDFSKLSILIISQNNLTDIDLSNNDSLVELQISVNNLTTLDVSKNLNLARLYVEGNNISEIDISNNLGLTRLAISGNPLVSLDVTLHKELTRLEVNNTLLESLNVTENIKLAYLDMNNFNAEDYQHTINSIDLTNNPELITLIANHTKLSSIDLSNNSKLEHLEIFDSSLTQLDVSNMNNLIRNETFFNNIGCIKVNEAQLNNIPEGWIKDDNTIYAIDCNINFIDDFNDCDISDCKYFGGNSIGITESGFEGCGVYMTHFAGDELINFYHTDEEFDYGYYEVDALADSFISDNNIYLFQEEDMNGGIVLSFRPNNTDTPGFMAINLTSNNVLYESSSINVTQDEWYRIKLRVEPTMITVLINDEKMYSINTEGIVVPINGKWRFKLGVVYSGAYDNMKYSSF